MCVYVYVRVWSFSPIIIITATELLALIIASHKYLVLFIFTDTSKIVNTLVTISPTRVFSTMSDDIVAPLITLYQTVLSATSLVLLSKIVQLNVTSVPSQNVPLAGS